MSKASDRKDEQIIAALISNPTIRAASAACGVSESQIYKRLRDDGFRARYDHARQNLIAQATAYIQGLLGESIAKIKEIMQDEKASPQVQLNAADALLRNCYKMTEQADILQRLSNLEAIAKKDEGN